LWANPVEIALAGRKRTIDRDKLLDAAEVVVTNYGPAALSIDSVAQAANVTKGGVQYAFGTKDALVDAMIERWAGAFDEKVAQLVGGDPEPIELVQGHIEATRQTQRVENPRLAGVMAAMVHRVERRGLAQQWYGERIRNLDLDTKQGRDARLAFFATEGIFLLRGMGFIQLSEDEWLDLFDDVQALLDDSPYGERRPLPVQPSTE
jgi:AcrR family transcriptional regulator